MADRSPEILLDGAKETLTKLEKLCCRPERSPAMQALAHELVVVGSQFETYGGDVPDVEAIIQRLERTGAQIGKLQVGCCAPARMPLYADLLTSLMELQRIATGLVGGGH